MGQMKLRLKGRSLKLIVIPTVKSPSWVLPLYGFPLYRHEIILKRAVTFSNPSREKRSQRMKKLSAGLETGEQARGKKEKEKKGEDRCDSH